MSPFFTGSDYALTLPLIMLTLFALGILVLDLALPKEWKRLNALMALGGIGLAAAATFKIHRQFLAAENAGVSVTFFDGFRGASPVSRSGVRDLLLAVSRLLVEQPRVVELDLNPVRCAGAALTAVDVKVRIAPPHPGPDPLERALNPRSRRAVQDA